MAKSTKREPMFNVGLGELLGMAGVALIFAGGGLLLFQCAIWLKDGHWPLYQFQDLWKGRALGIEWVGLRRIVQWLVEVPLSVAFLLAGIAVAIAGVLLIVKLDKD